MSILIQIMIYIFDFNLYTINDIQAVRQLPTQHTSLIWEYKTMLHGDWGEKYFYQDLYFIKHSVGWHAHKSQIKRRTVNLIHIVKHETYITCT